MEDNTFKIYERDDIGEVRITEEVIAIMAGLAATEVEGVESLSNNITGEIAARLGRKNLAAGIKVAYAENCVAVTVSLVVKMGYSIPAVSREVQDAVKSTIEGMTGLKVNAVDIEIANVKIEK